MARKEHNVAETFACLAGGKKKENGAGNGVKVLCETSVVCFVLYCLKTLDDNTQIYIEKNHNNSEFLIAQREASVPASPAAMSPSETRGNWSSACTRHLGQNTTWITAFLITAQVDVTVTVNSLCWSLILG